MSSAEEIKSLVLSQIFGGRSYYGCGRAKFRADGPIVHVRFCSVDKVGSPRYKFNINANTLSADYEVWICGYQDQYFMIPISEIRSMYQDHHAYPDKTHPGIVVVSVNVDTELVNYASGGKAKGLSQYFNKTLA